MLLSISLKLVFGLVSLMLVTRVLGKKALADVTPFDLIYTLVLGGILEESIYDDKLNIGHLVFALFLWAVLIYIIERIVQKNTKVSRLLKGEPSVIIRDGVINLKALSKNHIEMEQLRTMLRQQQCFSLENAKHVILESAGQVSVLKKSQEDSYISLMLVDHGIIQDRVLETHGLTRKWLLDNLNKEGYTILQEIIYVEWSAEKAFYILTNHDVMNKDYCIDG
ncbi:DUF421 domain-containing protein [Aerococcus viridans]|uniref:DUF421 domain-containing protein n=1 Tax=Aerococcus viridans TaxID=1377 RepID=A0A2J9PMD9_9LACT|nr:DUF421 domain-containing protein [Aerococcus viridans]MCT1798096.1 DUF421 domain-containing protein [Aerococcus viridans]PNL91505.1 DUF421 domain-containing protein [Aerococcus viridans]